MAEKTLLLVGGTSDIGRATALHYAEKGWRVLLAARSADAARRNADDIATRTGRAVSVHDLDQQVQAAREARWVGTALRNGHRDV